MKPFYSLAGLNVPMHRTLSFSLTDQAGFENDRVEVVLDNSAGDFTIPEPETELRPIFGYERMIGAEPYYNGVTAAPGTFFLDEVEYSGPPDRVSLYFHSSYMGGTQKSAKTRDWHDTTLGKIAAKIAGENKLGSVVDQELDAIKIKHRDQTEQSDFAFLSKLADENGAALKVSNKQLILLKLDKAPVTTIRILRTHIVSYRGLAQKKSDYDGVKARFHDYGLGKEVLVVSGDAEGDRFFDVKEQFKTEAEALAAAKSKHSALKKEGETFSFTCVGDPRLKAEARIVVVGAIPNVTPEWIVDRVTHKIDASGYTATCDCITPEAAADAKKKAKTPEGET